ncbi:family 43 glycosylhydrolase [Streptomyces coeruleorubidus]|uniref:glycoside hydrolase family 43 protein n=1 Tax=Streptomyces coeruleorubidus TaxID=116188 RepID=UPI0033E2F930
MSETSFDTLVEGNSAFVPIVPGAHPDPTICCVGEDYYLAHSSFEYFPGVPLWHSRDLVSWTRIGHILTRRSQFVRGDARPSSGLYAGTLRHHDGRFWYVTTNVSDYLSGQVLVHAEDPAGPWSDPVHVSGALGIDPDIVWDEDGRCYLTWTALSANDGEGGILQAPLDTATGKLLDQPYRVWQGTGEMGAVEGPHLYPIDGHWYLVLAEGGTERGHAVTVARAPHPAGPFTGCPGNPVLTHRSTSHPTQNTGHADLVRTTDGGWAAVYLGVRPQGPTPGFHVLGRETFLAGVDWTDEGWPVFDEGRYQVPVVDTAFEDRFDKAPVLNSRWVAPGGEPETLAYPVPDGSAGIQVRPGGLLCTRVQDLRWTAEAKIDGEGSFQLRMDHRHHYTLTVADGAVTASARIGDLEVPVATAPAPNGTVVLRLAAQTPESPPLPLGDAGPDTIVLGFAGPDGQTVDLARLDGRYLSTEVASGFTGRVLALAATDPDRPALVRAVRYRPER